MITEKRVKLQFENVVDDMIREAIRSVLSKMASNGVDLKQYIHDRVKTELSGMSIDKEIDTVLKNLEKL